MFGLRSLLLHLCESPLRNFLVHHLKDSLALQVVILEEFTLNLESKCADLVSDRGETFIATRPRRVEADPYVAFLVLFPSLPSSVLTHIFWDQMLPRIEGFGVKNEVDALVRASSPLVLLE